MTNKVVRWLLTFIFSGFITMGTLYWRRVALQGGQPQPEFFTSFGWYSAWTTAFASLSLAFMFWIANNQSKIPVPDTSIKNIVLTCVILALIALNCSFRSVAEGMMRWDEFFVNLDAIVTAAACVGVAMALRLANEMQSNFGSFLVERSQATGNSAMLKEAEDILKKSLALSPNNFTASFGLGNLYLNRGDAAVALPYLMAANRQNPEINVVYYRLAVAYTKIGDKDKAKLYRKESERRTEYFNRRSNTEQLTRESPKDPALRIKLARTYAEGGDLTRAINQYQVYLTMKPEDATARKERDALVKKAGSSNVDIPRSEGS